MRRRFQRGVAAIEFAILLIPLFILVGGMTELGRALYNYNQLVSATRDAARYLTMQAPGEGEAQARCLAVHGNPACSGDPILPGLTTAMVKIEYEPAVEIEYGGTPVGSIDLVHVKIEGYRYFSMVPAVVPEMIFASAATTMRQANT